MCRLGLVLLLAGSVRAAPQITVRGSAKVDFGKYPASHSKIAKYRIANTGDADLKITSVWKGCQCASAKCDKNLLKPGEEARVEIEILADSIAGFYEFIRRCCISGFQEIPSGKGVVLTSTFLWTTLCRRVLMTWVMRK